MADISKCNGEKCNLKESCYRYTAVADPHYQSYIIPDKRGKECDMYWGIEKKREMIIDECNDNRYELINKYKQKLIECTNIETNPAEMDVIDNILFRFCQMGWLNLLEKQIPKKPKKYIDFNGIERNGCPSCPRNEILYTKQKCCDVCGQEIDWSEE